MGIGSPNPLLLASAASGGDSGGSTPPPSSDPVTRSLRLDGSAYLSRSTGSTNTTWTLAFWVKRATISGPSQQQYIATWAISGSAGEGIAFRGTADSSNLDKIGFWTGSTQHYSTAVYRDPAAWAHICISVNSGTATVYYNGESILSGMSGVQAWGSMRLGAWLNQNELEGYMADVYGIEGSALDHTSFTESNDYGGLKPKAYTGSFGTNGFHLKLDDSSDIGADDAGSNDFTATNLSSHDVMLDTPTKNYATLNPLERTGTRDSVSEGNLKTTHLTTSGWGYISSTMGLPSGKWVWAVRMNSQGGGIPTVGFHKTDNKNFTSGSAISLGYSSTDSWAVLYTQSGYTTTLYNGSSNTTSLDIGNFTNGDRMVVAVDIDAGKAWWGKFDGTTLTWHNSGNPANGTNATATFTAGTAMTPAVSCYNNYGSATCNFGQDATYAGEESPSTTYADSDGNGSFDFQPPNGFLALCSDNLDAPTVTPSEHFDVLTYNGAYDNYMNYSGTSPQTITGTDFTPEIIWIKDRDNVSYDYGNGYHGGYWFDNVMGTGYALNTDLDNGSHYGSTLASGEDGISSFNSNGFTVDEADETNAAADSSGYGGSIDTYERYVAWCWKLGTTASSWSGSGQDPDSEKYNASAGVSIIDYYDSVNDETAITLNHSLGAAPEFAIAFDYEGYTSGHYVWHKDLSSGNYLKLHTNSAQSSDTDYFPASPATATTFTLGTSISAYTQSHVALFTSVEGMVKVGSWVGNGSTDGPVVYCGFRPSLILAKAVNRSNSWYMWDDQRDGYNVTDAGLWADLSSAESNAATNKVDILSNGFKLRGSGNGTNSSSSNNYIFIAWAHSPFSKANSF